VSEITKGTFVLAVNDLEASRAFYRDKLGFTEVLAVEGWSFLQRGACTLRIGDCPDAVLISKHQDHSWFAYLYVTDAAAFFEEVKANDVEIWHPLADKPWGMREFAIVTPDGHRIVFGESIA